jgi:hypothetical protein
MREYIGQPLPCASKTCTAYRTLSCPKGGMHTLGNSVEKARRIIESAITDADIDSILSADGSYKTKDFTRATSGTDYGVAVVDRHAYRISVAYRDCISPHGYGRADDMCGGAKGHGCGKVPEGIEYMTISRAYMAVAAEYGEAPSMTQAITWVATRRMKGWVR